MSGHKLIKTTYRDNVRLLEVDPSYAESIERLKDTNPNYYRIYSQGLWGKLLDGLIYPEYDLIDPFDDYQFYGLDFGFNDETALVGGKVLDNFQSHKKDYFIQELLYKRHLEAVDIVNELNRLGIKKNIPVIADSARPEIIATIKKAGYKISPCKKFSGSVVSGINDVKNHNLKVARGSKNLIIELQNYQWKSGKDGQLNDEPVDSLDHLCDAFRYGLQALDRPKLKIGRWSM